MQSEAGVAGGGGAGGGVGGGGGLGDASGGVWRGGMPSF
mgnify:FL=1